MTDSVQGQLLGHLLGALDDCEEESIGARLKTDARLRSELEHIRRRLEPLRAVRRDFDPPPGLAERTCRLVAVQVHRVARPRRPLAVSVGPGVMSPESSPPSGTGHVRWVDVAVAVGVFVAASLLIIPAIQSSRFHSRLTACQDNLFELGRALTQYGDRHDGYFPGVPAEGKLSAAGIYAAILKDSGLLPETSRVVCPGSPMAGQSSAEVPSLAELQEATGDRLLVLRSTMGGSYGYSFGHVQDGVYRFTKNLGRSDFALMADVPLEDRSPLQSFNHGGKGQNVLFEDGHVRFVVRSRPFDEADDFFANDNGVVDAGVHVHDSVIAPSSAAPLHYVGYR
ncbi:MAG TPA: hypothetical protein VMY42_02230 [Thermoguttaceae bacterium]|nr:hypothetical protein [Thermoguttaceae bacterium]